MSTALCVAALGALYARKHTRVEGWRRAERGTCSDRCTDGGSLGNFTQPERQGARDGRGTHVHSRQLFVGQAATCVSAPPCPLLRVMLLVSLSTSIKVCTLSSRPRSLFEGYRQIRPSPLVSVSVVALRPMQCVPCNASNAVRLIQSVQSSVISLLMIPPITDIPITPPYTTIFFDVACNYIKRSQQNAVTPRCDIENCC